MKLATKIDLEYINWKKFHNEEQLSYEGDFKNKLLVQQPKNFLLNESCSNAENCIENEKFPQ